MTYAPQDDPELIAILGANLTAQFTPAARDTIKWEASKFPAGVARVVTAVLNDPSVRSPCPVILDRLRREQHHDTTTPTRTTSPIPAYRAPTTEPPHCPTCGFPTHGYVPVRNAQDGCETCGRPHATTP